jgi:hypothetical protein
MPAIASLEDLKAAQKEGVSIYAMLYLSSKAETTATEDALCFTEMAQDRLEECMQIMARREESGTVKR